MKWKLKLDNDHLCEGGMVQKATKWKAQKQNCGVLLTLRYNGRSDRVTMGNEGKINTQSHFNVAK